MTTFRGIFLFVLFLNLYTGLHGWFFLSALGWKLGKHIPAWLYWLLLIAAAVFYVYFRLSYRGVGSLFGLAASYWGLLIFVPFFVFADLLSLGRLFFRTRPWCPPWPVFSLVVHATVVIIAVSVIFHGLWQAGHAVVTKYSVSTGKVLPKEKLRVVLVSDLHIGAMVHKKQLARMVSLVNSLEGDIILLAGDIIDRNMEVYAAENLNREMSRLKAPLGVYAVPGNHDYFGGSLPELRENLRAAGIRMLEDEAVSAGGALYVIGRNDYSSQRWGSPRKPLTELSSDLDNSVPLILMDHQPRSLGEAEAVGIDLQVSGHTHKGQIWPGPLVTKRMYENDYGLLNKGKTAVVVSSGYGTWGPPLRIGTLAEVVLIELEGFPSSGKL
jgi:predicted MPP superfamily phosphohydrolase